MAGTLEGVGQHYRDLAERHRDGVDAGRTPAAFAVSGHGRAARRRRSPARSTTTRCSRRCAPPEGLDVDAWRATLRVGDREVACDPAWRSTATCCATTCSRTPGPTSSCGLHWLEGGADAYDAHPALLHDHRRSAQEIHDIGLAQVAELADEYRALGPEVVGTDDLGEIFEAMRTDPALHFTTGDELVEASKVAMARASAAMARLVRGGAARPRAPSRARLTGAKAFYFPPAERRQPRRHVLRQHRRPVVVGHLRARGDGVPRGHPRPPPPARDRRRAAGLGAEFRKHVHNSAYAEGWGLYSERLSDEMGLYATPVDRMGMLAADSMRAMPAGRRHRPARASAGAVSRRSTTWSRTPRSPRAWCAPRSTATWSRPGRPRRT